MPISDLVGRSLVRVERTATLKHAAELMRRHKVGSLIVMDDRDTNRAAGIITDRDIAMAVAADNIPQTTPVEDIMSGPVVHVEKDAGIASVVERMEMAGVRRLVLVDEKKNACGVISADDLFQLIAGELSGLARLIKRQVTPQTV